jgi:hypothetical protein
MAATSASVGSLRGLKRGFLGRREGNKMKINTKAPKQNSMKFEVCISLSPTPQVEDGQNG